MEKYHSPSLLATRATAATIITIRQAAVAMYGRLGVICQHPPAKLHTYALQPDH